MAATRQLSDKSQARSVRFARAVLEIHDGIFPDRRCRHCGEPMNGPPHPVGGRHVVGCVYGGQPEPPPRPVPPPPVLWRDLAPTLRRGPEAEAVHVAHRLGAVLAGQQR